MEIREQYKNIVGKYDQARRREFSRYVTYPSIVNLAGRLDGLNVLDMGCGSGFSTRTLATLKPRKIVGVDAVAEQLDLAQEYEEKIPMGIRYCLPRDISEEDFGRNYENHFDLVTTVQVLTYMPTVEKLRNTINNASRVLNSDGRFIGIIGTPSAFRDGNNSYGLVYTPQEKPMKDGSSVKVELKSFNGASYCKFDCHYYSEDAYRALFEEARFNFRFLKPIVTLEGIEARGINFWKDFLANPPVILFEGRKDA
jgi:SAM-dependent methyltransferase